MYLVNYPRVFRKMKQQDPFSQRFQYIYIFKKNYTSYLLKYPLFFHGWSGGAMVLDKLPVPGRPTILNTVGQGPIALAVGAGGVV